MTVLDEPRATREGEELDPERLAAYLSSTLGWSGPLEVRQFPSGHSNLTYLVKVGADEAVLRRPPFGAKVKSAHDMGREHRILSRLSAVYPLAPAPLLMCDDASVLGAPFYLMRRLRGVILRKASALPVPMDAPALRALSERFIDTLAELHAVDWQAAGLAELGRPEGYVRRQVTGWTERYRGSQTDELPDIEAVATWLADRLPAEQGATIVHGDFKYDNVILDPDDPTRIIGVLDWEMSTIGDPLVDLGVALGYWIEAGDPDPLKMMPQVGPTLLPGNLTRRQLAERYAERTGRDVTNMVYYFTFALFKIGVVLQQIYYRYRQGHTKDPRFANLDFAVRLLAHAAARAAETGQY